MIVRFNFSASNGHRVPRIFCHFQEMDLLLWDEHVTTKNTRNWPNRHLSRNSLNALMPDELDVRLEDPVVHVVDRYQSEVSEREQPVGFDDPRRMAIDGCRTIG